MLRDDSGMRITLSPTQTRMAVSCQAVAVVAETATRPDHAAMRAAAALRRLANKLEDKSDD